MSLFSLAFSDQLKSQERSILVLSFALKKFSFSGAASMLIYSIMRIVAWKKEISGVELKRVNAKEKDSGLK